MSYTPRKSNGDSVSDLYSSLCDFNMAAPNLLIQDTEVGFLAWFDKCRAINKRALNLYLREHKHEIKKDFLELVRGAFAYPAF